MYRRMMDPAELMGLPERIEEFLDCGRPQRCLAFNSHGTLLAAGCEGGEVVLWDYQTRGLARVLPCQGAPSPVIALAWTSSGRRLAAGSALGQLVVWDVLNSTPLACHSLGPGICLISSHVNLPTQLLVSLQTGPAQLISLAAWAPHGTSGKSAAAGRKHNSDFLARSLPVATLDCEGKAGVGQSVQRTGASAAEEGQLAIVSTCGRLAFAATKGTLLVLRLSDLAILDVIKIHGLPRVTGLSQYPTGGSLLVSTQDRVVRIYTIDLPEDMPVPNLQSYSLEQVAAAAAAAAELDNGKVSKRSSLLHADRPLRQAAGPGRSRAGMALLNLKFNFLSGPVDKQRFTCSCFSPDGEHVVAAVEISEEQQMHVWGTTYGDAEQVLQAATDPVIALAWHPQPYPMQLLALGSSGCIYIWAKVWTENWSGFAPDFQELEVNREYVEQEDEFDVNPRPQHKDTEMVPAGGKQDCSDDDEPLDIMSTSQALVDGTGQTPSGDLAGNAEPPLSHLPVQLPAVDGQALPLG